MDIFETETLYHPHQLVNKKDRPLSEAANRIPKQFNIFFLMPEYHKKGMIGFGR